MREKRMRRFNIVEQWEHFTEFTRQETTQGGPDPQIKEVAFYCQGLSHSEVVWRAGCYAATHCVPTAIALWNNWDVERMAQAELGAVEDWLKENWTGIALRPERKSVRIPANMAKCLHDFANFALNSRDAKYWNSNFANNATRYEMAWQNSIGSVKYFARYMAMKFLEILRVTNTLPAALPDMRPQGAWSPRLMLGLLYPKYADLLNDPRDTPEVLSLANALTEETISALFQRDVKTTHFSIQVMLCEYREMLAGGFYPGATHDEEMEYEKKVTPVFGTKVHGDMYRARAALFDERILGEFGGWSEIRRPLWNVLFAHGYVWSDLVYDYKSTKDPAQPVKWHDA